jgi:hypothetical protein
LATPTSAQVTLEEWTEVFGTVDDQQLGRSMLGLTPSLNLPYRAAISRGVSANPQNEGATGFYILQDSADTEPQLTLRGEYPLAGDLNGDGWTDIVLNTWVNGFDTVVVNRGTAAGVDTSATLEIPGEEQWSDFRPHVIGDLNNDGHLDLINGALDYAISAGKLYFHLGPALSETPDATLVGDSASYHLGTAVKVGDLNADGLNDIVVRGYYARYPVSEWYDYIRIYWGVGSDTLDLTPDVEMRGHWYASNGLECFDVNGDSIDDLLWTNLDSADFISVHYGGATFDTLPSLRLENPIPGIGNFGFTIQNAGDMNGDGYDDIVMGCPDATITSGFVFFYGGGPLIDEEFDAAVGMSNEGGFGESLAGIGDVTGDGLADIMVGAPHWAFFQDKGYWGIFKGDSEIGVTDVEEDANNLSPAEFWLGPAYPNPFNPQTTIRYDLPGSARVRLEVFNLLGEQVALLVDETQDPGSHSAFFDGKRLASGVYVYRLTTISGDGTVWSEAKKVVLMR